MRGTAMRAGECQPRNIILGLTQYRVLQRVSLTTAALSGVVPQSLL